MNRSAQLLLLLALPAAAAALEPAADVTPATSHPAPRFAAAGPLRFEENLGQTDPQVRFLARTASGHVFLTPDGIVVSGASGAAPVHVRFVDASPSALFGAGLLPGRSHYLKGNDPGAWQHDVPAYGGVRYADAWPGVDLSLYGTPDRLVEFDVVAAPHADLDRVRLAVPGAVAATIAADGTLVLARADGEVRLHLPAIWQADAAGTRRAVAGRFVVHGIDEAGALVGFAVDGRDPARTLVIDPVLAYSSYLGGSEFDEALDVAVDADGCAYVLGFTRSADFPLLNAYDGTIGPSDIDAFVTKFSADGSSIVYSTFVGGNLDDAFAFGGIGVDAQGVAYIGGITAGGTFPVTGGAFQTTPGGLNDGFVTALAPDGSSLLWSTFLGGSLHDRCEAVAVDPQTGSVFATGITNSSDFPITPGAYDSTYASLDTWVARLSAGGLVFSTFVGGSSVDQAHGIAAFDNTPYVCGESFSNDFPVVSGVAVSDSGTTDAVAFRLNATGTAMLFSTYLPGGATEAAYGIAADPADGSAYVCGRTNSADFLTTPGAFLELHPNTGGFLGNAVFLTKLGPGGPLAYSTYLGGPEGDAIAWDVDARDGRAAVTGRTSADDFPLVNAFQSDVFNTEAFVTQFEPDGASLRFSTVLGGGSLENHRDGAGGIACHPLGTLHVAGTTGSTNFPTTPGSFQDEDPGQDSGADAFVLAIHPDPATDVPAISAPAVTDALTLTSGPNPFRGSVRIAFTLPAAADVRLDIVTVGGRRVRTIDGRAMPAGASSLRWDGRDDAGAAVAAGVYLARLTAAERSAAARLVLLR